MRSYRSRAERHSLGHFRNTWLVLLTVFCGFSGDVLYAQATSQESLTEQIQQLTKSMARTQAQLQQSQRQLDEMRQQLNALQSQMAQGGASVIPLTSADAPSASSSSVAQTLTPAAAAAIDDLRERQAMQESQIATHEQTKVESESKYPVKITGLLLLNSFSNTRQVDMAATPTVALPGLGSTGASVRQTVLGFNARGPHLFGARSYADLSIDFNGNPQSGSSSANYTGYYNANSTFLRLRTVHAGLQWQHREAYFALDRPIFSPDVAFSLIAVAEPALAWSGNLWTWNPQVGATQDLRLAGSRNLRLQAALIDVGDAPLSPVNTATTGTTPTTAEQSRWPGAEAHVTLLGSRPDEGSHLSFGGYFAPHLSPLGSRYDAWAGTLDARFLLPARLELTASFYRGEALGGLGGGAYKDFGYRAEGGSGNYYFRPLDDVGGWAQLKEKISERVELNAAFGLDNVFAKELRPYAVSGGTIYQNLARNRTLTGNVIYSPSVYLLLSLEYRHVESSPVNGLSNGSNVIGLGAEYKF